MNATQQHLLDLHRAARLSRPAPPPPGRHDRSVLRDLYRSLRRDRQPGEAGRTSTPGPYGTPGTLGPSAVRGRNPGAETGL
ncbi:hypothetical protein AB0C94_28930 [Streptomyces griseus]|uniref:hypothetical protein n=1 Tax=unclassified Streptomyces TaxID=2593676 RepID=UPI000A6BF812|nr:hypothetical protein [Streptomyces sp. MnatMP-M77]